MPLDPSPALSLLGTFQPTLSGRRLGVLVTDGVDGDLLRGLRAAATAAGASVALVAPRIGGVEAADGAHLDVQHALSGAPSVLFDAVVVAASASGAAALPAGAVDWVRDAWRHLKVIGYVGAAAPLLARAGAAGHDEGLVNLEAPAGPEAFVTAASAGRRWEREPGLRW